MRISRLEVEHVKSIDHAIVEGLASCATVLLTGPNGSGKSSLFDAIRIFKSSYGVYSPNYGVNYAQYGDIVTLGQDEARVSMELVLSPEESEALGLEHDRIASSVSVGRSGNPVRFEGDDANMRRLFGREFFDNPTFGKIEHIPSDRSFTKDTVSQISFTDSAAEQEIWRMVDDTTAKFANLKSDLLLMHMIDLQAESNDEESPEFMRGVARIFEYLLDDVTFQGVRLDRRLQRPPEYVVATPRGEHGIDSLSSGQREILMTYVTLEKRKYQNSIVLFDEPELHLNGSLERRVLSYVRKLAESGNQFWIATHSPEIIDSVVDEAVYRMTGGCPNTAERIDLASDKISILRQLGAAHHIQMISQRIAFVEGPSDSAVLGYFSPGLDHTVSFVQTGGVGRLVGATDLLNRASAFDNFRAIRDRDDLSLQQIEDAESRANGRLHVWRRRHVENYLLDEVALQSVLDEWESYPWRAAVVKRTRDDLARLLRGAADATMAEVVARRIENGLRELSDPIRIDPGNHLDSLATAIARRKTYFGLADSTAQTVLVTEAQTTVQAVWEEEWRTLCLGKETLMGFVAATSSASVATILPILVERICKWMREQGRIPQEVADVLELLGEG